MNINELLIEKLKLKLSVKKDHELASFFNVTPVVFSAWKRSRYKLLYETVKYGLEHNLDFNSIFFGLEEAIDEKKNLVRILPAEDLFSYYLNPEDKAEKQQRQISTFLVESTIGFQVISQNMEPSIVVSSYVFGVPISIDALETNTIYIVNVKEKGIYISRFTGQIAGGFNFENDNHDFESYSFMEDDIIEVFRVEANFKNFG